MSNKIYIVGLGPNDMDLMTYRAMKLLKEKENIVLRTAICGGAKFLEDENIAFTTMDSFYESIEDFDNLEDKIAGEIISMADDKEIVYAVPGSGIFEDGTVDLICQRYDNVEVVPGISYANENLAKSLPKDISNGSISIPAAIIDDGMINPRVPMIITELDDAYTISEIKILLSKYYDDEHMIKLYDKSGVKDIALYQLDWDVNVDHMSSVYIPKRNAGDKYDLYDLKMVFAKLRSPNGCPWDREQTHVSLKRYLIEECAEVLDAIDNNDMDELSDELGDVLLQVMFHSAIAEERGDFDIYDVIYNLCDKLIRRHPHVFSDTIVEDSDEVLQNWDEIKKANRKQKTEAEIMQKIPRNMNALIRAQKVQERAKKVGFDWDDISGAFDKVAEELEETIAEYKIGEMDKAKKEVGDLLFAVINVCRMLDVLAEFALNETTTKFVNRFSIMEQNIIDSKKSFSELSLAEMDVFWEDAKKNEA